MSALSDCYGTVTTVFGAGGDMYNGGHRGTDYRRGGREPIYSYDDIVVQSVDHGSGLGWSVGAKRLTLGGYCGWAHVYAPVPEGTHVPKGGIIGYAAGFGDDHGTLWTGPHIHTTQGAVSAYNCSVGIRPLSDPAPVIAAALATATTASTDSTPLEDPDMARRLNIRETKDGTNNTPTLFFDGGPGVGIKPIQSPAHLTLLNRYLADKPGDHMYPGEIAILNSYLRP